MLIRNRGRLNFQIRNPEQLESRDLLSGHALAGGFSHFAAAAQFAGFHGAAAQAGAEVAALDHVFGSLGSLGSESQKTVLTAQLTDPDNSAASGTVTYKTYTEDGVTETEFKVTVKGAAANTTLDVSIGDTVVGQITTDANGAGTLKLSSEPEDADEQPLPANFPTAVAADTAVSVGTLSGTLAAPTKTPHGCGESEKTVLRAALTDSVGTATGTATYQTATRHGETFTKFVVRVSGATASSTLDVAIDGTVVGQITTDANGAGKLVLSSHPKGNQQLLPADFPAITAGTSVTVGSLSGTFATPSDSAGSSVVRFGRHR